MDHYRAISDAVTDQQREVACYLWLSPYHPETWPMKLIDRLVALREHDERKFLLEIAAMTYHAQLGK